MSEHEDGGRNRLSLDALLPHEIAEKAEDVGVAKARLDGATLFGLAVLGGSFIGFGAMFATTALAGTEELWPYGPARALAGFVFAVGLILVVIGGAELFTGNALMTIAWASGKIRLRAMLRAWSIVFAGNLAGAVGTAGLSYLAGHHLMANGAVGRAALGIASAKAAMTVPQLFFAAILANVLVCLAVWLALGARTTADKVLAILFPVAAFVAAGFEHVVANMYVLPLAMMIQAWGPEAALPLPMTGAAATDIGWGALATNLAVVTAGNVIGGGALVGGVYWLVYLRRRRRGQ